MEILNEKEYKLKTIDNYETFVAIDGADDHYISSSGRLIRLFYNQPVVIPQHTDKEGNVIVDVLWNGKNDITEEHAAHLVGKAFLENEGGCDFIWYKDGDRRNINCRNLFYVRDDEIQDVLNNPERARIVSDSQHLMSYYNFNYYKLNQLYYNCFTRCYKNYDYIDNKYYKDVEVCDEWQNDKNSFYRWARENVYGYPRTLHLDKDILSIQTGKRIYSPENCCFVPEDINVLFRSFCNNKDSIKTNVNKDGKITYTVLMFCGKGRSQSYKYDTEEDALNAFKRSKLTQIGIAYRKLNDFGYDVPKRLRDAVHEWYRAVESGKIEFETSGLIQ